jgi:hypothetical protein
LGNLFLLLLPLFAFIGVLEEADFSFLPLERVSTTVFSMTLAFLSKKPAWALGTAPTNNTKASTKAEHTDLSLLTIADIKLLILLSALIGLA